MLTIDDFTQHVIIQHKRTGKRFPKGTVVAIGPGIIGWSLRNNTDRLDRAYGLDLAFTRALEAQSIPKDQREEFYTKIPISLLPTVEKVLGRSYAYYK